MAATGVLVPPPPEIIGEYGEHWTYEVIQYSASADLNGQVTLPGIWNRLKEEGIFDIFFHDLPDTNFAQFVSMLSAQNEVFLMIMRRKGETVEHIGMVVLSQILNSAQLKRASGGFLFFRKYWNHKDADLGIRAALDYIFGPLEMDVIIGVTPKMNRASTGFLTRIGMKHICEIPRFSLYKGQVSDGSVFVFLKEEYLHG